MGVQPMKYVFPVRRPCWPGVRPPQESPKLTGNSYCCSWNFLQQEVTVSCSDTCLMFSGRRSGVPWPETASSLSLDSSSGPPTEKPARSARSDAGTHPLLCWEATSLQQRNREGREELRGSRNLGATRNTSWFKVGHGKNIPGGGSAECHRCEQT